MITEENSDSYWIPANKTDQVRITTMITAPQAASGLALANAIALKKRGWKSMQALERWWKGVPELSVPVTISECAFTFMADGVIKVLPFEATVP